jgi:hypothetical protein
MGGGNQNGFKGMEYLNGVVFGKKLFPPLSLSPFVDILLGFQL